MACGKPIITSLTGEGSRIIDVANAGFTSKSEDTVGLINCIKKALKLNQDELSQLGKNARQYFEKEFEREKLINKLDSILS